MNGLRRIGMTVVAGSLLLPLAACSRTSDGSVVMDKPAALPSFNLLPAKPIVPSWMKFGKPQPEPEPIPILASNFPPAPETKSAPRRKVRPPVVTTSSGKLACRNVSEGGRVKMVCK